MQIVHRYLWIMLVLLGCGILFFPKLNALYRNMQQEKLIANWKEAQSKIQQEKKSQGTDSKKLEEETDGEDLSFSILQDMVGVLKIDAITLEVPILEGSSSKNLSRSVTTVEPCAEAGQVGNFVIAGHNNYDYGRNFNRLGEIAVEDTIIVETEESSYLYQVTEIFYVKPEETWVLEEEPEKSIITLITCYPRETGEKRLIIRGTLIVE